MTIENPGRIDRPESTTGTLRPDGWRAHTIPNSNDTQSPPSATPPSHTPEPQAIGQTSIDGWDMLKELQALAPDDLQKEIGECIASRIVPTDLASNVYAAKVERQEAWDVLLRKLKRQGF